MAAGQAHGAAIESDSEAAGFGDDAGGLPEALHAAPKKDWFFFEKKNQKTFIYQ